MLLEVGFFSPPLLAIFVLVVWVASLSLISSRGELTADN